MRLLAVMAFLIVGCSKPPQQAMTVELSLIRNDAGIHYIILTHKEYQNGIKQYNIQPD